MKVLIILLVGIAIAAADRDYRGCRLKYSVRQKLEFFAWKKENPTVTYRSCIELRTAMESFFVNSAAIQAHNNDCDKYGCDYRRGLWQHSDWSEAVKLKYLCGARETPDLRTVPAVTTTAIFPQASNLVFKNWTAEGRVLPVVDQGRCGCCWSFSAAAIAEGVFLKQNPLSTSRLSPQYLIDCETADSDGCDGGYTLSALKYIQTNKIATNFKYPFKEAQSYCKSNVTKVNSSIYNATRLVLNGNETLLRDIVSTMGPVGISMNADGAFGSYKSGIFNNVTCVNYTTNHAMLLVGYGSEMSNGTMMDYWLVKNSWGKTWGLNGYVKMRRNGNNQCGIARYAYVAYSASIKI
ncbi:unnamed protein product [Diamesa tonsa]